MNIKELEALIDGVVPVLEMAIQKAIAPLLVQIERLDGECKRLRFEAADEYSQVKTMIAALPVPTNGEDCDMDEVRAMVADAVKAIPAPKDGDDGKSITVDDVAPMIRAEVERAAKALPVPKDGVGVAGAMIDRDGSLQLTLSNGEVKNLGKVDGKNGDDGKPGTDGKDGLSFENFDMRYIDETSELEVRATAGGITKEVRFHIGGMRGKGYWRDGVTAKANEAWSYGGQLWIAVKETKAEPRAGTDDWFLAARKGKDAETVIRTAPSNAPIRLGA